MSTSKLAAHQKHHRTVALEDDQGINYGWVGFKTKTETVIFDENRTETEK